MTLLLKRLGFDREAVVTWHHLFVVVAVLLGVYVVSTWVVQPVLRVSAHYVSDRIYVARVEAVVREAGAIAKEEMFDGLSQDHRERMVRTLKKEAHHYNGKIRMLTKSDAQAIDELDVELLRPWDR